LREGVDVDQCQSIRAYEEALRLRPAYPAALEYLGEAYVALGRLDDARTILGTLRSLAAPEAADLEEAIAAAEKRLASPR
jgi:tetratricopeptide (TPR) repeat protein